MINKNYLNQVKLLVQILPEISNEKCFALKGGTAINLFYSNLPRLSVDIDLTYIPFDNRATAYSNINSALDRINTSLNKKGYKSFIRGGSEKKIICEGKDFSKVKIEPNYTLRGVIGAPQVLPVCEKAEDLFGYTETLVLSKAEVFGGKICAALDRQHPRDLFDIYQLVENNGLNAQVMQGFVVMLLGAGRPIYEMITPNVLNQETTFNNEFQGMTDSDFSYKQHIETLKYLTEKVQTELKENYKDMLFDFVRLNLNLNQTEIPNLEKLPAIQWKLQNLKKLQKINSAKFDNEFKELEKILG